jgi:hypothetical protein
VDEEGVQGAIPKAFGTTLPGPLIRNGYPGATKCYTVCYILPIVKKSGLDSSLEYSTEKQRGTR